MKLKKRHIFTITACAIAALFLTCVLVIGLAAEDSPSKPIGTRGHENSIVLDPAEDEVDSLDISWLTGPVTVGISPDDKIYVTERSAKEIDEADRMKAELSSGTLKIRWDSQWFRRFFNVNLGWFGQKDKELEVLLPRETAGALVTAEVSNTSGTLSVTGCTAETMDLSTVSGTLEVSSCLTDEFHGNTVSGNIELTGTTANETASLNTVSGGMDLSELYSGELTLDTVSGACRLTGEAKTLNVNTISGDVTLNLKSQPEDVDMDSVSGGLTISLPPTAGFTLEHDTVSGGFDCAFPTQELGGGRVRCGEGGADISLNTTSGSMSIKRRDGA